MLASSNYYFTSNCYFTGCSILTTTKMRNALNPPLPWSKLNWPETTKKKWNHPCHDFETTWKPASYSLASFSLPLTYFIGRNKTELYSPDQTEWIFAQQFILYIILIMILMFIFLLCLPQNLMLSFSNYIPQI